MLLYNKYLFKSVSIPATFLLITLSIIIWLTQIVRHLDLIISKGISLTKFFYLSILLLPPIFFIIIPISLFISIMYVIWKLITNSELIILKCSGASTSNIAKPIILISILACLLNLFNSLYLLPLANKQWNKEIKFLKEKYFSLLIQPGVFLNLTENITIFINEEDEEGMLKGVFVNDSRQENKIITIVANQGKFIKTKQGTMFSLKNGTKQEIDNLGNFSLLSFDEVDLNLKLDSRTSSPIVERIDDKDIDELLFPSTLDKDLKSKMQSEAHLRISWPIYSISLTFIALISCFWGRLNRYDLYKRIYSGSLIATLYIFLSFTINNLPLQQLIFIFLTYIIIIIPIYLGIIKLYKSGY